MQAQKAREKSDIATWATDRMYLHICWQLHTWWDYQKRKTQIFMLLKPLNITGVKQHHETESLKPLETSKQKKTSFLQPKAFQQKLGTWSCLIWDLLLPFFIVLNWEHFKWRWKHEWNQYCLVGVFTKTKGEVHLYCHFSILVIIVCSHKLIRRRWPQQIQTGGGLRNPL